MAPAPRPRNLKWWAAWIFASFALAALLAVGLLTTDAQASLWRLKVRGLFVPGATTSGHHQIELACESCHAKPWAGREALQESCMRCHGAELKEARDTHPKSKFTDPRNAERAALLDAAQCVTCHVEHRPTMTRPMGVTLPDDYCVICHRDIAKERPTHAGSRFTDCTASGCHNFHDNRALYEDFLVKHAHEPAMLAKRARPARDFRSVIEELSSYPIDRHPLKALGRGDIDAPGPLLAGKAVDEWLATAHARSGVGCKACHQAADAWVERPGPAACKGCHGAEVGGFLAGRHGMRLAAKLPAMDPAAARLPMKTDAAGHALGCGSCHAAHAFDTRKAEAEACSGCHADRHTRAYGDSPHARLAGDERVTCATCHLPRVEHRTDDVKRVLVQHNQNDTLRPADKMLRPVCMQCHGLQFSLDALADPALVASNFRGRPAARVTSIDWALDAERRAESSRKSARKTQPQGDKP